MIEVDNITVRAGEFMLEGGVAERAEGMLCGADGADGIREDHPAGGARRPQTDGARERFELAGGDVTHERPAARGIGYVPQDGALFSTMTVREHLAFALEIRRVSRKEIAERVDELARMLGITELLPRRPAGLSGGERQRVALGRALSFRPGILLLDEPLSAVDEETRGEMYDLLRKVQSEVGVTALHITHSPSEAGTLADVVFVLREGRIGRGVVVR